MLLLYPCPALEYAIYNPLFTFHYASTISVNVIQAVGQRNCFTFHYASTISRRWCGSTSDFCLYIPLCFYYIMEATGKHQRIFYLYIPLCFYYIRNREAFGDFDQTTLHSTMLLLYRSGLGIIISVRSSLHSTMLLLYRKTSGRRICFKDFFTFHYASTISPG